MSKSPPTYLTYTCRLRLTLLNPAKHLQHRSIMMMMAWMQGQCIKLDACFFPIALINPISNTVTSERFLFAGWLYMPKLLDARNGGDAVTMKIWLRFNKCLLLTVQLILLARGCMPLPFIYSNDNRGVVLGCLCMHLLATQPRRLTPFKRIFILKIINQREMRARLEKCARLKESRN